MTAGRATRARGGKGGFEPRTRIRRREQDVLELATQGRSQHEIARAMDLTQPAVSQILRRLDERWLHDNQDRVARHKAEQTRKLDHVYREAMQAWEQSKAQRTRRRQRKTNVDGGGEKGAVAEVIVDDSHGDPRYLEAARRALADLARLWGTAVSRGSTGGADDISAVITLDIGDDRTAPRFESLKRERKDKQTS